MAATTTTLPRRKRIFRCPLSSRAANDGSHSAEMRAPRHCTVVGPASALVVMLLLFSSLSVCGGSPSGGGAIDVASSGSRQKRGVVPGNAASRPKNTIRRSECRNDNSCKLWPKTSCGKDPVDGQLRCLCADQTHPINDDCITSPQELGMPCERDIQCIQLAYCAHNASALHMDFKICQCREEFSDDDGSCSGGVREILSIYLAILVAIVIQNNHN